MKNKSAKDLAFDRERAKYGKRIRELEVELKKKDDEILVLHSKLSEAEGKCENLQDWINRLLEYTEMSEDDMKKIIQKDKDSAEIMEHMNTLFRATGMLGKHFL